MACYLIDLDGTIYCGPRPLPYAAEFIRRLNQAGRPYRFLTNAPERSPRLVERELRRMGIPAAKGSVLSAGVLSVEYLAGQKKKDKPLRVCLLGNRYIRRLAALKGLVLTDKDPDWLLVSFGEEVTIGEIRQACRLIRRGVPFLATNPDDLIPSADGLMPHTGAILRAITQATGVEPLMIGKPSNSLGKSFLRLFGCTAQEIRVIGDRLDTDMAFARSCGFQAWLMLTGSTGRQQALEAKGQFDRSFSSMEELALPAFFPEEAL